MMIKTIVSAAILLLPFYALSAPSCTWVQDDSKKTKTPSGVLVIDRFRCTIENYPTNHFITPTFKASVIKPTGERVVLEDSADFNKIQFVTPTPDFPFNAVLYSAYSASNNAMSIRLYDENWNYKTTIYNPLTEYQATNRRGSENRIAGFLRLYDDYYIEALRSLGGECNSCQKYAIDLYEITDDSVVLVNSKPFDITKYRK